MRKIGIFLMGLLMLPTFCKAGNADTLDSLKAQADKAFAEEKYEQAAVLYNQIADSVVSVNVCYNLGCTYYRLDDMAKSVLWFERALKLNPADEDIEANLQLAREKTIDRITAKHNFVVLDIFYRMTSMLSLSQWTWACLTLFVLTLVMLALFLLADRISLRKSGFFASIFFLLLCILGNVCALYQQHESSRHDAGIVMSSVVTVKSTPSEGGNDLFLLHEGTRIEIRDNSLNDWAEIEIADGKVGWIQKKHFVII
ncbi:MAG: tetratricopeptide repeat protein [Bacteroidaceae bacterium]